MSLESLLCESATATELPYEILAYQRFLAESGPSAPNDDAYLFYEPRIRFLPEPDDILVPLAELVVDANASGALIHHAPTRASVRLPSFDSAVASRILSRMDGTRSLLGVQLASQSTRQQLDAFLAATFGRLVFVPRTLERFEARLSGLELVRFVGSPYEIRRSYWANMADCRARINTRLFDLTDLGAWLAELRLLHIICLIGADGRSFYRPQSPLGRRDARPGALYTTQTRSIREHDTTLFVEGPRVSASLAGGRLYHTLLCASVDDAAATLDERSLADVDGNDWGTLCVGFARDDTAPAPWFCPPRPMTQGHLECIFGAFAASRNVHGPDVTAAYLDSLADFQWYFVRLHPFRCANQSLGMNIVNARLTQLGRPAIPHLLLDQFALRLTREAYRTVFARAVNHWGALGASALDRWRVLSQRRQHLDQFVGRLGELNDESEAPRLVESDPTAARLALLLD